MPDVCLPAFLCVVSSGRLRFHLDVPTFLWLAGKKIGGYIPIVQSPKAQGTKKKKKKVELELENVYRVPVPGMVQLMIDEKVFHANMCNAARWHHALRYYKVLQAITFCWPA